MLKARNQVKVFELQQTASFGGDENAQGVCAHGKTAVYWENTQAMDVYFREADCITEVLIEAERMDLTVETDELYDLGLLDDDGNFQAQKVAKYLAKLEAPKAAPVVHLFVNWLHEEDLQEEDFGMVAGTVAKVAKALDKLKADGWTLTHGTSDEGPHNRIAFYLATHPSVKTVEDAQKRLRKLEIEDSCEVRNEPLELDE